MIGNKGRAALIGAVILPPVVIAGAAAFGLMWGGYIQYILGISFVAIACAAALILLVGLARIITLASGAMMGLGAYTVTILMVHSHVPFLLGVVGAIIIGGFGGIILGVPATRFRGHQLAMVTLVFQFVVIIVIRQWPSLTGGTQGMRVPTPSILGLSLSTDARLMLVLAPMAMVTVVIVAVLARGHFGKILRAISSTEIGAEAFGINIAAYHKLTFIVTSALIAFAGAVQAPHVRILDPQAYGIIRSVLLLAYPIVGGMTSIWGALFGGGVMTYLPEVLRVAQEYQELVYSAVVLGILIFLPGGIVEIFTRLNSLLRGSSSHDGPTSLSGPSTDTSSVLPSFAEVVHSSWQGNKNTVVEALGVRDLYKSYGALVAVDHVSLSIPAGRIHGLIGPNGAGKTTLFNLISGFLSADAGDIEVFGASVDGRSAQERIAHGVTRTFQHVAIYGTLSCLDNVIIGLGENGVFGSLWKSVDDSLRGRASRLRRDRAFEALCSVGLGELAFEPAGALSLGNQRRLEIARAIVSDPRLLLLDEPVSGLEVDEEDRLSELLSDLNRRLEITMLVIEHNVRFVAELSQSLSVMNAGSIIVEGQPAKVIEMPEVRRVYFGEAAGRV